MKLLLGIQNKRLSHSLYSLSSWCLFDGDTWWHHPLKQQSIAFTSPTFPFESKRLYRIVLFLHSIDRFHMISSMFKHHLRPFHHISTWKRLVNRVNSPCHWVVAVPRDHEIDSDPGTLDSKHMSPHVSRHSVGPLDMDGINENIRIAWCSLKTEFSCELVNCVEEFYFHIQLANGLSTSFFRITETRCGACTTAVETFLKVHPLEILHPSFMGFCHQSNDIARTLFWHKDILPKRSLSDPFKSFIA